MKKEEIKKLQDILKDYYIIPKAISMKPQEQEQKEFIKKVCKLIRSLQ